MISPVPKKTCKCILFADDTTLIYYSLPNITELCDKLTHDLQLLEDWFRANKLSLNVSKTNFMIFPYTKHNTYEDNKQINISGQLINRVSYTKFLGITRNQSQIYIV